MVWVIGTCPEYINPTWRVIPVSKWLITMVSFRPLNGVVGPLTNGRTSWLINGGDPNHLHPLG